MSHQRLIGRPTCLIKDPYMEIRHASSDTDMSYRIQTYFMQLNVHDCMMHVRINCLKVKAKKTIFKQPPLPLRIIYFIGGGGVIN